ncbi:MAG: site-specific DNA-methyltransferase [Candidatus Aminicenantes bacterium]|nr:site-specific DNA-methyltransferase [Candidatus Aminicenantes bacterium]
MDSRIKSAYSSDAKAIVFEGSCLDFFKQIPDQSVKLIVTSPPYNIGKEYEKKIDLKKYYAQQEEIICECVRILSVEGSICWQVGNFVNKSEIIPLDIFLYPIFQKFNLQLRNRIIWHFEHGLHCSKRLSGRYETILWFTKSEHYTFNLDNVRVPQKYPNKKYFKGPKTGEYSCNPLGKNPSDVWNIPNVKFNHIEKTIHPCQFPVELIERLIVSLTNENDWIFDPFLGVGTSIVAAIINKRKGMGAEIMQKYVKIAKQRINLAFNGDLKTRPKDRPIYDPINPIIYKNNDHSSNEKFNQLSLFEKKSNLRLVK